MRRYFLCLLDEPPGEEEEEEDDDDDDDRRRRSELPSTTHAVRADSTLQAAENDNVTLRCERRRNGTVHAVTVEKMAGGEPWSLVGECRRAQRPPPPGGGEARGLLCTDDLDVSVQLAGVAQRDGGLYRCNFSTDGGVHSTTVLLTVAPAGTERAACTCKCKCSAVQRRLHVTNVQKRKQTNSSICC